jgi:hypothetical protein
MDRVMLAVPLWFVVVVGGVGGIPYAIAVRRGWIPDTELFIWTLAAVLVLACEIGWRAYANRE